MFVFASNLQLAEDMMQNIMVSHHTNQVIKTLDKIVILLTKSSISDQEKLNLFNKFDLNFRVYYKKAKNNNISIIL